MFDRVTIIGMGLLGAGVARQIRQKKLAQAICGVNRSLAAARFCKKQNWIDVARRTLDAESLRSDLIVLALPVRLIGAWLKQWGPKLSEQTLVIDVGSTKSEIVKVSDRLGASVRFVGCHPMAGLEHSGAKFADQYEFAGKTCFVTPGARTRSADVKTAQAFWRALGMLVTVTSPEEHDAIVARTSHLPQLVATSLAAAMRSGNRVDRKFFGTGFKSATRLATSSDAMWADIFATNRANVLQEVRHLRQTLQKAERALAQNDIAAIQALMKTGAKFKRGLLP